MNFDFSNSPIIQRLYFFFPFIRAIAIITIGFFIAHFLRKSIVHACKGKLSQHVCVLLSNIIFYAAMSIIGIMTLQALGFNLSTLLGAAGVAGVALGFASQTSIANIISGLFLLFEQSFSIGDIIKTQNIFGVVESIDLFSVKIRTFDNTLIRIANESLLKQEVTNITYYDKRRIDIVCEIAIEHDFTTVKKIIEQTINEEKNILSEPKPVIIFKEVKEIPYINQQRMIIFIRFWAKKESIYPVKNTFIPALQKAYKAVAINAVISHGN